MQQTECAYIAGLLDGEGTFSAGVKANDNEYYARVAIFNTDLDVLKWIRKTTGFGWVGKGSGSSDRDRVVYCWSVSGRQAEPIVRELIPFLQIKKRQAKAWIVFRSTFDGTSKPLTDGVRKIRRALITKIQALNQKGRPSSKLLPHLQMTKRENAESNRRNDSPTLVETPVSA